MGDKSMRRSKNPQDKLGAAIRQIREECESTQRVVADGAGITRAHMCAVERGHANPTWETVTAIAGALGVSVAKLAERAEGQRQTEQKPPMKQANSGADHVGVPGSSSTATST